MIYTFQGKGVSLVEADSEEEAEAKWWNDKQQEDTRSGEDFEIKDVKELVDDTAND